MAIKFEGNIDDIMSFTAERLERDWRVSFVEEGSEASGDFTDAEFGALMALMAGYGEDDHRDPEVTTKLYKIVEPKIVGWAVRPIP